jgi:hypothetical protein
MIDKNKYMDLMLSMSVACHTGKIELETWIANTEVLIKAMKNDMKPCGRRHSH